MRKDVEEVLFKGVDQFSYHKRTGGSQEVVPVATPMGQFPWECTQAGVVRQPEL